jgi:hypothetical protein
VCGVLTDLPSGPACRLISVCVRTWVLGCGAGQGCRVMAVWSGTQVHGALPL